MKNIFIFGSCVTRDAFTPANTDEFFVLGYVARHSLARLQYPAFSGIDLAEDFVTKKIPSAFQRRMLQQDWDNNLLDVIKKSVDVDKGLDFLVVDSVDERFGLIEVSDGIYVTNSDEFRSGQLIDTKSARKIMADSERFFQAWEYGFTKLLDTVPKDKIIYNNVFWSSSMDTGQSFDGILPPGRIEWCNAIMERLYATASKYLPQDQFVNYPKEIFVGDSQHK